MDWLPRLSVGGAMASAAGKMGQPVMDAAGKLNGGCQALRKAPNSPLDTNATLDTNEAQQHQQKDGKPPYSYANLITFAINSSQRKKMTLSEIYSWICENFPYYKEAGNGWKVCNVDTDLGYPPPHTHTLTDHSATALKSCFFFFFFFCMKQLQVWEFISCWIHIQIFGQAATVVAPGTKIYVGSTSRCNSCLLEGKIDQIEICSWPCNIFKSSV